MPRIRIAVLAFNEPSFLRHTQKGYWSVSRTGERLELLERLTRLEQASLVERGTIGTGFSSVCSKRDELDPQVKRKIFSDNPRRFYEI
jgi:hypothetical protein